jgi:HemK-like putative methylase
MNFNYKFNSRFIWYGPFNTKFYVDNNVYIPRSPIADYLQELIKDKKTILDLCCGSGALGIISALLEDKCLVDMSDINSKALKVANKNINNQKLNNRITCIKSDLFKNITKKYDLIIAVPPQISKEEYDNYKESSPEPKIAYIADNDGFYFIKKILDKAHLYLNKNGILIMETGIRLSEKVKKNYNNLNIEWYKFNGKDCILKYVHQ